jgi:hypothetical protein
MRLPDTEEIEAFEERVRGVAAGGWAPLGRAKRRVCRCTAGQVLAARLSIIPPCLLPSLCSLSSNLLWGCTQCEAQTACTKLAQGL